MKLRHANCGCVLGVQCWTLSTIVEAARVIAALIRCFAKFLLINKKNFVSIDYK